MHRFLLGVVTATLLAIPAAGAKRHAVAAPLPADNPHAFGDSYDVVQGAVTSFDAAAGVLANDFERNSKPLLAVLLVPPLEGTVTLRANGSFTYTHSGSAAKVDSFIYKASNGTTDSFPATVTLNIAPADAPRAEADSYSVARGGILNVGAPGVLGNDRDPAGKPMGAVLVDRPAHGALSLKANGSFVYAHDNSDVAADVFTYRATNASLASPVVTVTIAIVPPGSPAVVDQKYTVAQDTTLIVAAPGVLTGATDPDTPALSALLVGAPSNGTVMLKPDGSFTYIAEPGFNGADSFTFVASDGAHQSATGTASIVVVGTAVAEADFYDTVQGFPLSVPAPGVLQNDAPDAVITSYGAKTGKEQTALGTATPTSHGGTVTLNTGGDFVYFPATGFTGTDTFIYFVRNAGGITPALVTINVAIPPPTANNDGPYSTPPDQTLIVAKPGVLANDVPNGAMMVVSDAPAHGTVTLRSDGSFTYVPASGFVGSDTFAYTLTNPSGSSTAIVTINVAPPGP